MPSFDIASVKPTDPSVRPPFRLASVRPETTPGWLTLHNANLRELIESAWSLEDYQVAGGPDWMLSARFDGEGKATETASREQLLLMLRSLLADRYKVAVHSETRELAVYALVIAKGGPKFHALTASKAACWPACEGSPGKMDHLRMRDLPFLMRYLMHLAADRPIIDRTGLTGYFGLDIDMDKIMAEFIQRNETATNQSIYAATVDALPDQLGLQLVPMKAAVQILVVDHADKPSAN